MYIQFVFSFVRRGRPGPEPAGWIGAVVPSPPPPGGWNDARRRRVVPVNHWSRMSSANIWAHEQRRRDSRSPSAFPPEYRARNRTQSKNARNRSKLCEHVAASSRAIAVLFHKILWFFLFTERRICWEKNIKNKIFKQKTVDYIIYYYISRINASEKNRFSRRTAKSISPVDIREFVCAANRAIKRSKQIFMAIKHCFRNIIGKIHENCLHEREGVSEREGERRRYAIHIYI